MDSSKIVVANWKMNGDLARARSFIASLNEFYVHCSNPCVICPPYTLLHTFHANLAKPDKVMLGGQHCSPNDHGAYTGDISAAMLEDAGCRFVIVAHAERRSYFRESYRVARHQCQQALKHGLMPIVCLGEESKTDVELTLLEQLDCLGELVSKVLLAYEPVWAIGGDAELDIEHLVQSIAIIKKAAPFARVLYGGSVNSSNVSEIVKLSDGVMVGSASLDPTEFCKILDLVA